MALRFTFVPELDLVLETADAEVTGEHMLAARTEEVQASEFKACKRILTDARAVESPAVGPEDLRRLADLVESHRELYRDKRWAFVMGGARSTGLAMILSKLFTDRGILDAEVFSTMDGACEWLGIPPLDD